MNFLSDAIADFAGYLEGNQEICKQQMAEKASPYRCGNESVAA